ncbi:MAG: hypothetical protein ACI8RD_002060 [Bacillariaceae sp.]|jgi:hypothetical protein
MKVTNRLYKNIEMTARLGYNYCLMYLVGKLNNDKYQKVNHIIVHIIQVNYQMKKEKEKKM